MSIVNGPKIVTMVSAANGDTYGDGERHQLRTQQALIQANVKGGLNPVINTPPVSPANGDTYIVGPAPTGAWPIANAGNIAYWAVDAQDGPSITPNIATGAWEFYAPLAGWVVFDNVTLTYWAYTGTTWVQQVAFDPSKQLLTATSGTLTINPALGISARVNLNNQATLLVTLSNGVADGQNITILWVQGGTTATTVTVAANVFGFVTPTVTTNKRSTQQFTWDSTLSGWFATSSGSQNM
jgi:hypothetical protein